VFFCTAGRKIILLLTGNDKEAGDSAKRQERKIARACEPVTACSSLSDEPKRKNR
jgi:hypothetical protein